MKLKLNCNKQFKTEIFIWDRNILKCNGQLLHKGVLTT